MPLLLTKY